MKHPGADSVIRGRHVYGGLKWARGRVHDIKGKRWWGRRGLGCVRPVGEGGVGGGLRRWSAAF